MFDLFNEPHDIGWDCWRNGCQIDGWQAVGMQGGKEECLAYIDEVWTDMRPLSLRQALQAQEQSADEAAGAIDV